MMIFNYNFVYYSSSMIGTKFVGFMLIGSLSGLAYIKYNQLQTFNQRVATMQKQNQLKNYLFKCSEESSYFIDTMMDNFEGSLNQSHINNYKKTLLKMAEGKVLETCAGSNRSLKFYSNPIDLTLIDWSPKMASIGTNKISPIISYKYLIEDVTKMPFADNSFDTVVDIFGLEYVMEPRKALEQMRRVCKKGGTILLMNKGLSEILQFHYWENAVSGRDLINMGIFTNRNWQKIVKEFDFKVQFFERKKNGKLFIQVLRNVKDDSAGQKIQND